MAVWVWFGDCCVIYGYFCFNPFFPRPLQFIKNVTRTFCQAGIYLFKFNNGNNKAISEICSKLTIKTLERHQWHCSGAFIVNFEQVSDIVLVFPLLTLNKYMLARWDPHIICQGAINTAINVQGAINVNKPEENYELFF